VERIQHIGWDFLIELGDNLIRLLDIIGNDDIRWLKPYENRHI
jgi:hypothetical protein